MLYEQRFRWHRGDAVDRCDGADDSELLRMYLGVLLVRTWTGLLFVSRGQDADDAVLGVPLGDGKELSGSVLYIDT